MRPLIRSLEGLPDPQGPCLEVLALAGPLNRSRWIKILGNVGIRKPRRGPKGQRAPRDVAISTSDLKPWLKKWMTAGLVIKLPDNFYCCHPHVAHLALLEPARTGRLSQLAEGVAQDSYWVDGATLRAHARAALYLGNSDLFSAQLEVMRSRYDFGTDDEDPLLHVLPPESPPEAIALLPPVKRKLFLSESLERAIEDAVHPGSDLLTAAQAYDGSDHREIHALVSILQTLIGEEPTASDPPTKEDGSLTHQAWALQALARGDLNEAQQLTREARQASRGPKKRKKPFLEGPVAPLLTLALAVGLAEDRAEAQAQVDMARKRSKGFSAAYRAIQELLDPRPSEPDFLVLAATGWVEALVQLLSLLWQGTELNGHVSLRLRGLSEFAGRLERSRVKWLARQFKAIEAATQSRGKRTLNGEPVLLDLHEPRAPWERILNAVEVELAGFEAPNTAEAQSNERLIWRVRVFERHGPQSFSFEDLDFSDPDFVEKFAEATRASFLELEPRLQKRRGHSWTGGRRLSLKHLAEADAATPWLSDEDRRVVSTLCVERDVYSRERLYFSDKAPLALVGHPRVYLHDQPDIPIEVCKGEVKLRIERRPDRIVVRLDPDLGSARSSCEVDRAANCLRVYEIDGTASRLAAIMQGGLEIPAVAETRVHGLVERASELFFVQSDIQTDAPQAEEYPSDSRIAVQLSRLGSGLRVRLRVYPLGLKGPEVDPGEGGASVVAKVEGRLLRCERDLKAELAAKRAAEEACPSLICGEHQDGGIVIRELEDCLELLMELGALAEDVQLVWPDGQPMSVLAERSTRDLSIRLRSADEWFTADASLPVDDERVLDMHSLLARAQNARGRFIAIDDDRYLALTNDLLERVEMLSGAIEPSPGTPEDAVEIHPLTAGLISTWGNDLRDLKLDRESKAFLRKVSEAVNLEPSIPQTFEADLRPYQREGFEWLCRLAHWGAGACLADDMGLGKTIQALAVLVERAHHGPALVVAPTSVCANWLTEAQRFAPSLRPRRLVHGAEELNGLGPFDVLVVSYTMMALHIDAIAAIHFSSAVLDEAQAIKNPSTQRSRAARRLQTDFRMVTTGTPIENHLGELWSLMNFLNPGLLGTRKQFEARFTRPIQKEGEEKTIQRLRRLIAPFILRRAKRQVLRELPARTEIVLRVDPSEDERAFSEALRQRAMERIESSDSPTSQRAFQILAELTRLRLAACHPRLVEPDAPGTSAKLEELVSLIQNLREGGHRALIFSQFVKFLELVKTELEEEHITYQYLDGSTPARQRTEVVNRFQAGDGDVFLLSLKAGGVGLNLTAADYVIHLDPWWNPAVENQASDRAHRIGQRRPVTIYRMVTRGSIEERVLELHHEKKDLAKQLLQDASAAKSLDAETLLSLLASR